MSHPPTHSFSQRMLGAARVDSATYNEVEHDSSATIQAAGVVAIVAVCSAIGGVGAGGVGVVGGLIGALLGWLIWSAVTYLIGDIVFEGTATWGELLRTLGFAQAPGVLFLFAAIPLLGWLVSFVVAVWVLICGIVAIREALDFSTGRAILTAGLGWLVVVILRWMLVAAF